MLTEVNKNVDRRGLKVSLRHRFHSFSGSKKMSFDHSGKGCRFKGENLLSIVYFPLIFLDLIP